MQGVLSKLQQEAMDIIVDLEVKKCKEGAEQLAAKTKVLAEFLGTLRMLISKAANMKKEDIEDAFILEMENTIEQGFAHRAGITESIKAGKACKA